MKQFRFELTSYGWRAYVWHHDHYRYFGVFRTQRTARETYAQELEVSL